MTTITGVLVVDDEPAIRDGLAGFLEDYGYHVRVAASAEQALALLRDRDNALEVAIVDVRLPDMSGDEMILQAITFRPDLKYIIHTGSVGYRVTEELACAGIAQEQVLHKPLMDLTVMVDAIEALLIGT